MIDAASWSLIEEYDDFASELTIIGATAPTAGLPVIAAPGQDGAVLATALSAASAALGPADRTTLRLAGLAPAEPAFCRPWRNAQSAHSRGAGLTQRQPPGKNRCNP